MSAGINSEVAGVVFAGRTRVKNLNWTGGGWENNGVYTLKAVQNDLASEIEFKIVA